MPLNKVTVTILLNDKTDSVYCISVDSMVDAAVSEMNRQRVGSILVLEAKRVVGIFTERDVLTRIVATGRDPKTTPVREVMTADFLSIGEATSVEDAMQMMTDKRVRHLPVLRGDQLLGMVSIGDVTRWLLKVNEMEAENLRRYVFGDYPS
jgi:CBS domain-containing protein